MKLSERNAEGLSHPIAVHRRAVRPSRGDLEMLSQGAVEFGNWGRRVKFARRELIQAG